VLVAPNGRNVYVTSFESGGVGSDHRATPPFGAVVALVRDPTTGALVQLPGESGCVTSAPTTACHLSGALGAGFSAAISADGHNVYVASLEGTILILDRDQASGGLTVAPGKLSCLARVHDSASCHRVAGMDSAWSIAISPDDRSVYVGGHGALITFRRSPGTGTLAQAGCLVQRAPLGGCRRDKVLSTVSGLAVGPDGRDVYASILYPSVLATFRRDLARQR
jgi:DNA-binding beta-propeller fold protein YncE